MPEFYFKQIQPCPECRRVRMDDGGRAVSVTSSGEHDAWFRCRCCGHRWQLPVAPYPVHS